MKFTRIITFSLISALSVGTLVGVAEINKTPVNRQFKIEDITGDRKAIQDLSLENIIKVDSDSYEKVILTADDVTFQDTKYDSLLGLDEKILNNKEMYRGAHNANAVENDAYLLTAAFNHYYPYTSDEPTLKLAIKDKKTDEVRKETVTVPNYHSTQSAWWSTLLFETNNKYYYAMAEYKDESSNEVAIKIYSINVNTLQLEEFATIDVPADKDGYTDVSKITTNGEQLYAFISTEKDYKLLSYDVTKKKEQIINITGPKVEDYYELIEVGEDSLYLTSEGEVVKLVIKDNEATESNRYTPSYTEKYDDIWITDHNIHNGTLYTIQESGYHESMDTDAYLAAYDLNSGNILYEGKLPSMVNRGVGKYYSFGAAK